jgi:hypothetical protein
MVLGSTQTLTEMSIRNLSGGKGRSARKADNLTAICERICLKHVGASTSHNPIGLHSPVTRIALPFIFTSRRAHSFSGRLDVIESVNGPGIRPRS